jgi:hypothetical protein
MTQREINTLADAIVRLFKWQSRQLELKEQRKTKAMITRQRNLSMRKNRQFRLPD